MAFLPLHAKEYCIALAGFAYRLKMFCILLGHSFGWFCFALYLSVPDYDIFLEMLKFVIGDVLGTFVTFLFGMQIIRFVRLQKGF